MLEALLRRVLARLRGAGPVLVPEYPLELRPRWGWEANAPLRTLADRFALANPAYEDVIEAVCELSEWARSIPRASSDPGQPCWENDWWGTIDALVQCAFLRARDPAVYLEIGSGYSTLFARRAITDFGLRTRIIAIDPAPRAEVAAACDRLIRQPLHRASGIVLDTLRPGDVVLMDGSHVALMSTDATVFLLELLPALPVGVLVGIDDVFLPWDYPPQWAERPYGEQYLLAAFLLGGGGGFTVRFPAWWVTRCSSPGRRLEGIWPLVENRFGRFAASLWLERESG